VQALVVVVVVVVAVERVALRTVPELVRWMRLQIFERQQAA
jgi:hypothetical protein